MISRCLATIVLSTASASVALAQVAHPEVINAARPSEEPKPLSTKSEKSPLLSIGDAAPPIHISTWVKGTPIGKLEKGKVYVIDVWSTWCIPCLAAMSHTTELQNRFGDKGLVVIGVTATDSFGNSESAIRKMIEKKGDSIGFTVGIDAKSASARGYQGIFHGKTVEAYLGGALVQAIPAAFVIDRAGRIAFIGHPLEIDEAVEACLNGAWDIQAAREQRVAREYAQTLLVRLEKTAKAKDFDTGLALCEKIVNGVPHNESRIFAAVADIMADGDGILARRAPDIALKAGRRAVALTKGSDPGPLSVLASVYFTRGEVDKAIDTVTRAISQSEGGLKPVLEKQLAKYRSPKASQECFFPRMDPV